MDGKYKMMLVNKYFRYKTRQETSHQDTGRLHLNSAGSASILISLTGPVEDRDWIRVSEEVPDFLGFEVRSGGNHSFSW